MVSISPDPEGTSPVSPDPGGVGAISHDPEGMGSVSPDPSGTGSTSPSGVRTTPNHYGPKRMALGVVEPSEITCFQRRSAFTKH